MHIPFCLSCPSSSCLLTHVSSHLTCANGPQLVPTVAKPPQSSAASPESFTGSGSGSFGGSGSGSGSGSFPFLPFFFLPAVIKPPQSSSAGGGAGASGSGSGSGSGSSVNAFPFFCATRQRVLLSEQRYLVDDPPSCPSYRQLQMLPILYRSSANAECVDSGGQTIDGISFT